MPPTKIMTNNEVARKHRLRRRFMKNLTSFRRTAEFHELKDEQDVATDSDDSENDTQGEKSDLRKEIFQTKRNLDQTSEGSILRQRVPDIASSARLLPPAEAEIEPVDQFERFGRFMVKRQDSTSTEKSNQTQDSLIARLAESRTCHPSISCKKEVILGQLSNLLENDDPMILFVDDGDMSCSERKKPKKNLSVSFADQRGFALEVIHFTPTMYSEEEIDWAKAIVLLLSPKKKKFEFLHVSYHIFDKTPVAAVLDQLPGIASDEALKDQTYVALIRKKEGRELINTVAIQSYSLRKNEILVAVVDGHYGKSIMKMAKPLLDNKKIMKAVSRNRSKNISVHKLSPERSKPKSKPKKGIDAESVTVSVESRSPKIQKLRRPAEPEDDVAAECPSLPHRKTQTNAPRVFDPLEIPDMSMYDVYDATADQYLMDEEHHQQKVTLTRFLNAGILTAVVYGVQQKFKRRR